MSSEESALSQVLQKLNEDNKFFGHENIDNNVQSNALVVRENKGDYSSRGMIAMKTMGEIKHGVP